MADRNSNYKNLLEEAMKLYNFTEPKAEFIRHNENITYSILERDKKYLLRIHKEAEGLDFFFIEEILIEKFL